MTIELVRALVAGTGGRDGQGCSAVSEARNRGGGPRGLGDGVDPVTFEIIRHKLYSVMDEAIIALENVSGSPITIVISTSRS